MHPIVVDRTLLWALGVLYGLYALWGIASFLTGIFPIEAFYGHPFNAIWSAIIAVTSGLLVFYVSTRKEYAESIVTWLWLAAVSLYPVALIVHFFEGSSTAPHVIFIALAYLVVPVWRLSFLIRKSRHRVEQ